MNTPSTEVYLYSIEVDLSYQNVRYFVSTNAMNDYFNRLPVRYHYTDMMYIRKNGIVDIPLIYDNCEFITYIRYNNYTGRGWEYAFVVKKEFINGNMTRFYLQYDAWTSNVNIFLPSTGNKPSGIVLRKHFNPTIFSNTVEDGLTRNGYNTKIYLPTNQYNRYCAVVAVAYKLGKTVDNSPTTISLKHQQYDNYSYIFFPYYIENNGSLSPLDGGADIDTAIKVCSSPWVYTSYFIGGIGNYIRYNGNFEENLFVEDPLDGPAVIYFDGFSLTLSKFRDSIEIDYNYLIDDSVTDKKILTYPYTEFLLTNGSNSKPIQIEHISSYPIISINTKYVIDSNGVSVKYEFPYNNVEDNYNALFTNNSSIIPKYTTQIADYMNQHGFSSIANIITMYGGAIAGGIVGGPGGTAMALSSVAASVNFAGNIADKYMQPPITRNDGSMANIMLRNKYFNCPIIVKNEMFNDDKNIYLTKWLTKGYPTYSTESINLRTRKLYNYFKTERICFDFIPNNEDKEIIENAFNNGITLWHYIDSNNYGEYNNYVSNSINTPV